MKTIRIIVTTFILFTSFFGLWMGSLLVGFAIVRPEASLTSESLVYAAIFAVLFQVQLLLIARPVAPVVRCKECRNSIRTGDYYHCTRTMMDHCEPDDFCCHGKEKGRNV